MALFLPFLIFFFGVTVLFIYFSLALFLYQNRFSCYTSNETSFLVSLHCLSGKSSLNYSVSCQFSFLTYIKPFICAIETNNPTLNIPGYNLLWSDHPSSIKTGGVCMFYKDYLPTRRDDLCALTECIVVEVNSGTKSIFFTCNYRSPSQTIDEFESYCLHLTLANIDNTSSFSSALIGDFNARCTNWWAADIDSKAGKELNSLTSTAGFTQLIDKPTHFCSGGCSCIDLIFCNKPKLISEYGIDHSLF